MCPARVEVTVPYRRRVMPQAGIGVHRTRRMPDLVPGIGSPSRMSVEEALLDVTDATARTVTVAP